MTGALAWLEATHGRRLPVIFGDLVLNLTLMFGLLTFYTWFRKTWFQQSPDDAFANALDIIDWQERVGLSVHRIELPLQQWAIDRGLIDFFNTYYRQFKPMLYLATIACFLLAPIAFRQIRRIFLFTTAIAFPMYALYPLAPPRLMGDYGFPFLDTVAIAKGVSSTAMGTGSANLYAAMPSMHIGWTTIGALCIAAAFPWKRIGLIIGIIHLGLMSLTVMITGNHYWLDIAGGLLAVAIAWCLTLLLPDQIAWPWNRNRATDPSPPDGPVT